MGVSLRKPRSKMRANRTHWLAFSAAMLALADLAGCGNVVIGGGPQSVPLRFHGSPPDASVTIDDVRVGPLGMVAARGVRVLPGKHHVTVEAPGYLPSDRVVDAKDGVILVDVALVPVPE
jgi:hypothetical protein